MRLTAIAIILAIATIAHATDYVARIVDGKETERRAIPCGVGEASISAPGRLTEQNLAEGWRDVVPAVVTGVVKSATWTSNAVQWVETVTYYTAAELAQQAADAAAAHAAAESNRLATPIKFDQPIQARVELPVDPDHYYRLAVDTNMLQVLPVEIESTRLTEAQWKAARDAMLADRKTKLDAAKAGIRGQLQQRIENIERLLGIRP